MKVYSQTKAAIKARQRRTDPNIYEHDKELRRRWWKTNPHAKERMNRLRRKNRYLQMYGITPEEKLERIIKQGFKCANPQCGRNDPGNPAGWATDHNHETRQLRGELCFGCNIALGAVAENKQRILGLIEYLNAWEKLGIAKNGDK